MAAALYHFSNFAIFASPLQLVSLQFHSYQPCCSRITAASPEKSRVGRKAKRNAEIYNEIQKFLSDAGLAENHVPSLKELSQNGRQDLANIVRRRGYKYIRRLLVESDRTNSGTTQKGKLEELGGSKGQNENVEDFPDDESLCEDIQDADFYYGVETDKGLKIDHQSSFASGSSTLSLQEKVAKFIEHGELDTIEDCGLPTRHANIAELNDESENAYRPENNSANPQQKDLSLSLSNGGETLYENAPPSLQKIEHPLFESSSSRNTHLSPKEQTSNDKALGTEARKLENEAEIHRLKLLLHRKEMELTQLKEQIEKEKLSLAALQTEAGTKMSNAQKLISEKETQLQAAEESLSGLMEVEILYSGDGEIVELAGSFNGWHNNIRMDLQTPMETRTSRQWRVALWLYPGVYEIKFIVDGQWKVDPQRESITRGSVQNNIIQVDR